jgi:hypothetical protein
MVVLQLQGVAPIPLEWILVLQIEVAGAELGG